jgi:nitroreductase
MFKDTVISALRKIRDVVVFVAGKNRFFLRTFFYVSGEFDREFESTLKGRYDALSHNYFHSNSNANIRRCIHRLEKGLFHQNPRKTFGKVIFNELKRELKKYNLNLMDPDELYWLKQTLRAYVKYSETPRDVEKTIAFLESKTVKKQELTVEEERKSESFKSLEKILLKRKSVRFFKAVEVDLSKIAQCVEIAKSAPTACNRQPYHLEILTQKKDIMKIGLLAPGTSGWLDGVPVLGVVVGHANSFRFARDRHLIYFDSGLFVSNFVNALVTVGLASCICNWVPSWKADREAIQYLGYDLSKTIVCLIAIGVPSGVQSPTSIKKSTSNLLRVRNED